MLLCEIPFTDAYLGEAACWFSGVGAADESMLAPDAVTGELLRLRSECEKKRGEMNRAEFNIRHEGISYRVSLMQSVMENVFVLRKFPDTVPQFTKLGLNEGIIEKLMASKMTGLVVIAGAYGQGKTTTASALVDARLSKHGGVAITLEDPPEMPLQGPRGKGVCYQTWVEDGNFSEAARKAARWAPTMIFLGEVRDGNTANEALKASINGRLVICTLHADSVQSAIERICSLANSTGSTIEDTSSLLSNGLAAVMHQKLEGEKKRLMTEFLFLRDEDATGIKNMIRQRKFEQLGSEINRQTNRLIMQQRGAAC